MSFVGPSRSSKPQTETNVNPCQNRKLNLLKIITPRPVKTCKTNRTCCPFADEVLPYPICSWFASPRYYKTFCKKTNPSCCAATCIYSDETKHCCTDNNNGVAAPAKVSSSTLHGVRSVNDLRSWSMCCEDRRRYFLEQMQNDSGLPRSGDDADDANEDRLLETGANAMEARYESLLSRKDDEIARLRRQIRDLEKAKAKAEKEAAAAVAAVAKRVQSEPVMTKKAASERTLVAAVRDPSAAQSRDPSAAQSRNPSAVQFRDPSAAQSRNPSAAQSRNPSAAQSRNPSTVQFRDPSLALIKDPSVALIKDPSVAQLDDPSAAQSAVGLAEEAGEAFDDDLEDIELHPSWADQPVSTRESEGLFAAAEGYIEEEEQEISQEGEDGLATEDSNALKSEEGGAGEPEPGSIKTSLLASAKTSKTNEGQLAEVEPSTSQTESIRPPASVANVSANNACNQPISIEFTLSFDDGRGHKTTPEIHILKLQDGRVVEEMDSTIRAGAPEQNMSLSCDGDGNCMADVDSAIPPVFLTGNGEITLEFELPDPDMSLSMSRDDRCNYYQPNHSQSFRNPPPNNNYAYEPRTKHAAAIVEVTQGHQHQHRH